MKREGNKLILEEGEDRFSFLPLEIWRSLTFTVTRSGQTLTWSQQLLSLFVEESPFLRTVFSRVDSGRNIHLTDEKLIAEVRNRHLLEQASKVVDESLEFCDHVVIVCSVTGYSVIAVWKSK